MGILCRPQLAGELRRMCDKVGTRLWITKKIRKAWALLLHNDRTLPTDQMTACARSLFGFKRSSVQELLGWYRPKQFPLRNVNVDSGLRFLGYGVPLS